MMHDHRKAETLTFDQKKILKLFSYNSWEEYMQWIDEKLLDLESDKPTLPEIVEEEPDLEESYAEQAPTIHSESD